MTTIDTVVNSLPKSSKKYISKISGYVALTKPRIIELLLITTVPVMFLAKRGVPDLVLIVWTVVGGTLSAGGANSANMVIDRDIDAKMNRTKSRPLVTGVISWQGALIFSIFIEIAAFLLLYLKVNLLSAILALSAALFYVFIYTLFLKRNSVQNIVIGGAAGAMPVLIGWSAVTDRVSFVPVLLAVIVFLWTPPHFWALAIKYKDDYSSVKVPMLPSVKTINRTTNEIVAYTILTTILSWLLIPIAHFNLIYITVSTLSGIGFIYFAIKLKIKPTTVAALTLFKYSITYLTLLFISVGVDALFVHRLTGI